ncbi:hypothetical protein OCF61_28920 [Bacillus cereus]|nr:hypothetical protein [Bacillus cereus]
MENLSKEIIIPNISSDRDYWLVRTEAGLFYQSFDINNYIAIGWNEIDETVLKKNNMTVNKEDILRLCPPPIKTNDKGQQSRQAQLIANNINKFIKKVKKGDIVIIPSARSEYVTFGEVLDSDLYYETNIPEVRPKKRSDEKFCQYTKRKRVKWLKTIKKDKLDPELYKLFYSQHTITEAKDYAQFIDRAIDSLFIKGTTAHLTLHVEKKGNVNALSFSDLIRDTLNPIDQFKEINKPFSANLDKNKISIKTNVQSPGPIELIGSIPEIMVIASLIISLDYPKYVFKVKNLLAPTKNKEKNNAIKELVDSFNDEDFKEYNDKLTKEKETLQKHLKDLQIDNPEENINSTKEKAN